MKNLTFFGIALVGCLFIELISLLSAILMWLFTGMTALSFKVGCEMFLGSTGICAALLIIFGIIQILENKEILIITFSRSK